MENKPRGINWNHIITAREGKEVFDAISFLQIPYFDCPIMRSRDYFCMTSKSSGIDVLHMTSKSMLMKLLKKTSGWYL